jgi:hypothetical protein
VHEHNDRALTGNEVRPMHSTPQPPSAAAGEHFADAERILAALPLVKRSADRDRNVQVALVHATLAIAGSFTTNAEGVQTDV